MTARQKFWLKVVLAVTCPAWILPFIACAFVAALACMIWEGAGVIVESRKSHGLGGGQ